MITHGVCSFCGEYKDERLAGVKDKLTKVYGTRKMMCLACYKKRKRVTNGD